MGFTVEMARTAFANADEAMEQHRDYLIELDSAIGDADHGANMCRGFHKAMEKVAVADYPDLAGVFKDVAMAMMGSVGGSAGPLYGTLFMKMSQKLSGVQDASLAQMTEAFHAGVVGVMAIGKAQLGDKTMIDVLSPAVDALGQESSTEAQAWQNMSAAAEAGMMATVGMLAKKGRASYLGERSIGHQDPGATSSYLILNCFKAVALGEGA